MITIDRKKVLREEINKAIELIDRKDSILEKCKQNTFGENRVYEKFYNFATEDIRGYSSEFDSPKTFLTIGASGDQILNAVKLGAEKIDAFDLNRLSKRQCAQKVGAAQVLNRDELYDYFNSFSENGYTSFNEKLKSEDRVFWDTLYDFKGKNDIAKLYPYVQFSKEEVFAINPYLDEEGYKEFQERLKSVEINYIDADALSLNKHLKDKTYDAMNFSNIYEYINYGRVVGEEKALEYYKFIMEEMYPRLNSDGTIMVSYMYAFNDKVRDYVKEMIADGMLDELVYSGTIGFDQLPLYLQGMTSQNYAYSLLFDLFEKENIKKVVTEHVQFGQSFDTSHDMALCLKK